MCVDRVHIDVRFQLTVDILKPATSQNSNSGKHWARPFHLDKAQSIGNANPKHMLVASYFKTFAAAAAATLYLLYFVLHLFFC